MNLTEILSEVRKLSPAEKEVVAEATRVPATLPAKLDADERRIELFKNLKAKGLLRRIPSRSASPGDFEPVSITGKPLSDTIIEDRG